MTYASLKGKYLKLVGRNRWVLPATILLILFSIVEIFRFLELEFVGYILIIVLVFMLKSSMSQSFSHLIMQSSAEFMLATLNQGEKDIISECLKNNNPIYSGNYDNQHLAVLIEKGVMYQEDAQTGGSIYILEDKAWKMIKSKNLTDNQENKNET